MAFRSKKKEEASGQIQEKILDVDASMQGSMVFRDPVNLRINGKFEGNLDIKGNLTVGENAHVEADIVGENIIICGRVNGNVIASRNLSLSQTAHLTGNIRTPSLNIATGAILQGKCDMAAKETKISRSTVQQAAMTVEELARYLEVDASSVLDWAKNGRIPAQKEGHSWRFDRNQVDAWIASEKISRK